jgi:hypothetical protein
MASATSNIQQRGRALPAKVVALGAAVLGALTLGLALPASADDPAGGTGIIECRSGIVTQDGVSMSSMVVARVPAAQLPDTPGDCSVR